MSVFSRSVRDGILLVRTAYPGQQYRLLSSDNRHDYGDIWQSGDGWRYAPRNGREHSADNLNDAITGLLSTYGKKPA